MKRSELIALTEQGVELTVDALWFSYCELRRMASNSKDSGGKLIIRNTEPVLAPYEIRMIVEEGRGHVAFLDIKLED